MAETPEKNTEAAKTLGKAGGKKRAENMSPEKRSESAKAAAKARWAAEKAKAEAVDPPAAATTKAAKKKAI